MMIMFEKMENDEKEEIKRKAAAEAADGWTLVTHKSKKEKEGKNKKKSNGPKVLTNFYSAQIREAKRDQLANLREQVLYQTIVCITFTSKLFSPMLARLWSLICFHSSTKIKKRLLLSRPPGSSIHFKFVNIPL